MRKIQGTLYALLVGIDEYSPTLGRLQGCVNDVDHFQNWLKGSYRPEKLRIEVLTNRDATRKNIIQMFRSHLGQAGSRDVILFQYSGHGARSRSAKEFKRLYPGGKDEGLVCYDSREPDHYDLADKELAVLISELARNQPHIAVSLDCCHSGSGTRGADDFTQARARVTREIRSERPLETYLDGYYAALKQRGEPLEVPASRHILLAACERGQKAWESKEYRGVFSSAMLDALGQVGADISYADLFVRARAATRRYADNQTPQFETYRHFDAYSRFLGGIASDARPRYSVYFDAGCWKIDCGVLHGLPSDPDKHVEFAVYSESNFTTPAGHAETTQVGPQKSSLRLLDLEADPTNHFQAEVTSLPVPPLPVRLEGDETGVTFMRHHMDASDELSSGFALTATSNPGFRYALTATDGLLSLRELQTGRLIQSAEGYTDRAAQYIISILKNIATWERAAALQHQGTRMDQEAVAFRFVEVIDDEREHVYAGDAVTIDITKEGGVWREITAKLRADNRTNQPLHFALAYLSNDFGIQVPYNEHIEVTGDGRLFDLIVGDSTAFRIALEDDEGDEATHIFKLIVTTERVDDFLLGQESIEIGKVFRPSNDLRGAKGVSFGEPRKKLIQTNEWFTKTICVRLVRHLARINPQDVRLANGVITIKGHPSLEADISLSTAQSGSRGAGAMSDFYRALERQGLQLLNFSGTRGETEGVLELTAIQNPESVKDQPLDIVLDVKLNADEYILPLTFDGEYILLAGEPEQGADGRTLIHIDHIPEGVPDQRRSLGGALKLYFFKTYLRRTDVNNLCWVEYKEDGSTERHATAVADKVSAASNILLLVHGIIGDTEVMAEGLRLAVAEGGNGVNSKFDLVMTYDYENLNTPIHETARQLGERLKEVGLHAQDTKRLSLLVHSMGGLVARWFIEREGGHNVVDHLVMCGTPNFGSPFGVIDSARSLTGVLATIALNTFPAAAPFCAGLLSALGRSKKITRCLEQMNPESEFLSKLNAGDDPVVRYTILAGDVRDYHVGSDPLLARLVAKIGKGKLFGVLFQKGGHDIAVSVRSIQAVPDTRQPSPLKRQVACHHLNYFTSEPALRALSEIDW